MARTEERRRLFIGLAAALFVNAALLALLAPGGREAGWPTARDTDVAVRVELIRAPPPPAERGLGTSTEEQRPPEAERSQPRAAEPAVSAKARSPIQTTPATQATSAPQASPAALPSPPGGQGAKSAAVRGDSGADLRAKTALALRKLGACSRMTSGAGDAQDRELCTASFAASDGAAGLDSIAADKRADYDAAHARAGYLVPADAANPDFVTSAFKRGGTVIKGHAGCTLSGGKWTCVGH